jgi:hypothetical protein
LFCTLGTLSASPHAIVGLAVNENDNPVMKQWMLVHDQDPGSCHVFFGNR